MMGDTNQGTSDTVKRYMNDAYNRRVVAARKKPKPTEGTVDGGSTTMEVEDSWDHSVTSGRKQVIRGFTSYSVSGTNSQYDKHFDIACTPEAHVSLGGLTVHATEDDGLTHEFPPEDEHPAFFFHGLTDKFVEWEGRFYAYSDHNGVIVEVLRDKPEHAFGIERRKRERLKEDFQRKRRKLLEWKPDGGKV